VDSKFKIREEFDEPFWVHLNRWILRIFGEGIEVADFLILLNID
jgi:hypothetical protein